jgi:hypothetical protein
MCSTRRLSVIALALAIGLSASGAQAKSKPTTGGTQAAQACLAGGSTVVLKTGTTLVTVAFANQVSCSTIRG